MLILADENIPRIVVERLRTAGYDLEWIVETAPAASDEQVLALATQSKRVLLTLDKDFGNLVFKAQRPAACGIILYRGEMAAPEEMAETIFQVISSRTDWPGYFSVVDEKRIRMTPLPRID